MSEQRDAAYTTPREDVSALVPRDAMSILDVGCSNGALGASLRHARPGRRVVGIDCDAGYVTQAAARLDGAIHADLNDAAWPTLIGELRFDCIIFADVLEHLLDPKGQLRAARDHLEPGGCMIVSLPNIRHLSALYSIFAKGTFPQRDRGIFDKTHLRWFTIQDAKSLIADAGMVIEASNYSLRLGDIGGGRLNASVCGMLERFQNFAPIREFLAYQFCFRAAMGPP